MLSRATRMLAAATYLDPAFANRVVDELLADEQRAVVPSFFGLDLGVVARHAMNSKQVNVVRDSALTAIFLICLLITPYGTLIWTGLGIGTTVLSSRSIEAQRPGRGPIVTKVVIALILMALTYLVVLFLLFEGHQVTVPAKYGGSVTGVQGFASLLHTVHTLANLLLFPVAVFTTLVIFQIRRYRLLTAGFRYGDPHTAPLVRNTRVHQRIEEIERAQYGNITTYSCWSPFVGAGNIERTWSITLDLAALDPITQHRTPVEVNPVELHQWVRRRVVELRDEPRTENERINGLLVQHHVVASGARDVEHPLIDEGKRRPYALAMPETIEALVSHPQAGVRYYQRITVTSDGTPVRNRHGMQITEAEDQEVGVSAFVYFAVEGGMLYVEFVLTVMPPIRTDFHMIDALPRVLRPDWYPKVLQSAGRDFLGVAPLAPLRLIPSMYYTTALTRRMQESRREADEFLIYDYGARASIREFGAERGVTTYMQKLDAEKYGKLIERRVNEAVLDFLIYKGIDVAEYRQRLNIVQNTGVLITGGDVSGQVVNGSVADSVSQMNRPPAKTVS